MLPGGSKGVLAKTIVAVFPLRPKRGNPIMATSTITARRKGDPKHYVEGKIIIFFWHGNRRLATAQFSVFGPVRFTAGVSVSAWRVTKRVSEQSLCKEEDELERQNARAVMRLSAVLAIIIPTMPVIQFSRNSINYQCQKYYRLYSANS